jgi:hypothetical protein
MKNRRFSFPVSTVALLCASGCSSIVDGNADKPVAIYSSPAGAKLTIFDRKGTLVCTATTPATVNLHRAHGYFCPEKYRMVFEYPGYYRSQTIVNAKVDNWYLGNVWFGWIIGWIAVDPVTGAMWTLPPEVNHNLTSSGSSLTHEEFRAAERAANPSDQWREIGVMERSFFEQ